MDLRPYQVPSVEQMRHSLEHHNVVADGSEMGTGKTYKVCCLARDYGFKILVLASKSGLIEWAKVAAEWGIACRAFNYEQVRKKKPAEGVGQWLQPKTFKWNLPSDVVLVFDEAHKCGAPDSLNAELLVAAKRQGIPTILLSGTLLTSPLRGRAIGYSLGLHNNVDYSQWAARLGVRWGFYGWEWRPDQLRINARDQETVMEEIRQSLGEKFTRIRKADIPGFPQNQIIPQDVETDEMPELDSDYGIEARQVVEALKIEAMAEKAKELLEAGYSVPMFVNFTASRLALLEKFPDAGMIYGGQSQKERATVINTFQLNLNHTLIIMNQAGSESISLHDLNGRPRAALVSPAHNATEFVQVLGRIHRDGALSPAINYVIFASGVPVERRIRRNLERKLTNLTALNDSDLAAPANA